jgi:hypothetical protein
MQWNDGWEHATAYDELFTIAHTGRPVIGIPDGDEVVWVAHRPTPLIMAHLASPDVRVRVVSMTALAVCAHLVLPTLDFEGVDDGS